MNHSKIILVGCISAFVAITTALLGVAGTIIGSVLSSVLYNVLSEALEKPVENAKISTNFEWDIAYVFPLTYLNDAMRGVMLKGQTLGDVWFDLVILVGYTLLFFIIGVKRFNRDV